MIELVPVERCGAAFVASLVTTHEAIVPFPSLEGYSAAPAEVEWQGLKQTLTVFSKGDSHWVKWADLSAD
jgi:hypothetical protein